MRKAWFLVLCLIASSLVVTTAVHAREWMSATALECSGAVHTDGDADQTQGDVDKASTHHHGSCHGQFAAVASSGEPAHSMANGGQLASVDVHALPSRTIDPALRPPAA